MTLAVITGASTGIRLDLARCAAEDGCDQGNHLQDAPITQKQKDDVTTSRRLAMTR